MSPANLTEQDYWAEVQLLSQEIEASRIVYHTYEEVNRLALQDATAFQAINRDPQFWKTHMHCMQTTLFMTLSRIFDSHPDAHTIHSVIRATLGNVAFFSAASIERRKTRGGQRPDWLDDYMKSVWVPADPGALRFLKKALAPIAKRFEAIYRPIRHAIFAHRIMSDDDSSVQLFGGTNRQEVGQIKDFLQDLIDAIEDLYLNGNEPTLGTRDYTDSNQRIRSEVATVVRRLG